MCVRESWSYSFDLLTCGINFSQSAFMIYFHYLFSILSLYHLGAEYIGPTFVHMRCMLQHYIDFQLKSVKSSFKYTHSRVHPYLSKHIRNRTLIEKWGVQERINRSNSPTYIYQIRIPLKTAIKEKMCATRGIFPHCVFLRIARIMHPQLLRYCRWACMQMMIFNHSFGIIQIFCAQSNSDEDAVADDDGNLPNRFSAFTHTKSKWTYGLLCGALMQSCSLFTFKEDDVLYGLNLISILQKCAGPFARISANRNLNC